MGQCIRSIADWYFSNLDADIWRAHEGHQRFLQLFETARGVPHDVQTSSKTEPHSRRGLARSERPSSSRRWATRSRREERSITPRPYPRSDCGESNFSPPACSGEVARDHDDNIYCAVLWCHWIISLRTSVGFTCALIAPSRDCRVCGRHKADP